MKPKQKAGCAIGILTICIQVPMWYWLIYKILLSVNANETMWLVFYVYVPFAFAIQIAGKLVENIFDE